MPFELGQSGNPAGSKKREQFYNALQVAILRDKEKLQKSANALLNRAAKGELASILALRDTLDGKPAQRLVHSGDEDSPIRFALVPNPSENAQKWLEDIGRAVVNLEASESPANLPDPTSQTQGKGLIPDTSEPSMHLDLANPNQYPTPAETPVSEASDTDVAPFEASGSCSLAQDDDDTC